MNTLRKTVGFLMVLVLGDVRIAGLGGEPPEDLRP